MTCFEVYQKLLNVSITEGWYKLVSKGIENCLLFPSFLSLILLAFFS